MKLSLSKEAIQSLPEPGEDGVIRVTAGLKVGSDGEPMLVEVNDMPVDASEPEEEAAEPEKDASYADIDSAVAGLDQI